MKIIRTTWTNNKRFLLVDHRGFPGKQDGEDYQNWIKLKEQKFQNYIKKYDFIEVPNSTGGDEDYLCFDMMKKEYIWCENGFYSFYVTELNKFELNNNITLSYLDLIRH
jgi:hypothetical protein